ASLEVLEIAAMHDRLHVRHRGGLWQEAPLEEGELDALEGVQPTRTVEDHQLERYWIRRAAVRVKGEPPNALAVGGEARLLEPNLFAEHRRGKPRAVIGSDEQARRVVSEACRHVACAGTLRNKRQDKRGKPAVHWGLRRSGRSKCLIAKRRYQSG